MRRYSLLGTVGALLVALAVLSLPGSSPDDLAFGTYTDFRSNIPEFRGLFGLIKSTLRHNETSFPGKTGIVFGFSAGSGYPQIWLRDAATIIPASRYLYDRDYLESWLEEHLARQGTAGGLEDWFDSRGKSDKNTTETDQETSAVRSAASIARLTGPTWLTRSIGGETVIDRLERSLLFVLAQRFDRAHGLVKGAHTADWGDVNIEDADERAIYTDAQTHWTCDIYDQSMFYAAARDLAWLEGALGRKEKSEFWEARARAVQENADRWLWQKNRGFYRVHIHLDALKHPFDEDAMFAMGGNTEAVLSGLAGEEQSREIIETALSRQKTYGISTISGSLLPPYPKGTFKHPMMDEPFEYQNGGQWDWFGGKLVCAMFEHGFSRQAREKLLEIAKKNLANRGLYEWDTPAGRGRGSTFYSGSAGSLSLALFEGYFGFKISKDALSLGPKLGPDSAVVHVYAPASGIFAAYEHRWDPAKKILTLRYNSNFSGIGTVKILLPGIEGQTGAEKNMSDIRASRDGEKIPFSLSVVNGDVFVVVETDFRHRTLKIKLAR
jgi:hypothetical protein